MIDLLCDDPTLMVEFKSIPEQISFISQKIKLRREINVKDVKSQQIIKVKMLENLWGTRGEEDNIIQEIGEIIEEMSDMKNITSKINYLINFSETLILMSNLKA